MERWKFVFILFSSRVIIGQLIQGVGVLSEIDYRKTYLLPLVDIIHLKSTVMNDETSCD